MRCLLSERYRIVKADRLIGSDTTLAEKISAGENADDLFFTLPERYRELHCAFLDVENRIAAFALRKIDLLLGKADGFFLRPDESQKRGGVETYG